MTRSTGQRRFHLKDTQPSDPAVKRLGDWSPANKNFFLRFRRWLQNGGYSDSSLHLYGCAARLALGWLDKPFWEIDPQEDIDRVRQYIAGRYTSQATCDSYNKGLLKLESSQAAKAQYPLEYLKKMIKANKLSKQLVLEFGTDYHMRMSFKSIDKMQLSFILAPRVSED